MDCLASHTVRSGWKSRRESLSYTLLLLPLWHHFPLPHTPVKGCKDPACFAFICVFHKALITRRANSCFHYSLAPNTHTHAVNDNIFLFIKHPSYSCVTIWANHTNFDFWFKLTLLKRGNVGELVKIEAIEAETSWLLVCNMSSSKNAASYISHNAAQT